MKFIICLAGGAILTAVAIGGISGLFGLGIEREIWFGMLAPTLASVVARVAIERQRRLSPQKMLKCLIQAFVVKFMFFGVYIVVLAKTNQVRLETFVICFVFFYLALHMAEAFELRRAQARQLKK